MSLRLPAPTLRHEKYGGEEAIAFFRPRSRRKTAIAYPFLTPAPSHCRHGGAGKVSDAAPQGRSRVAVAPSAKVYLRWRPPDRRACHRGRKYEQLREPKKTPRHSTILPLGVAPRPAHRGTGLPSRGRAKPSKCWARGPGSPRFARDDDSCGRWVRSWAR